MFRWGRGAMLLLLVLVVGMLSITAGSASAAGWQPPVNASTSGDGFSADVAVDAQGNAVGVWARNVSGLDWEIVAATRPLGGRWAAPVALSGAQRTVQLQPKVAVDPAGNAIAVWLARPPLAAGNEATSRRLWAASRSPGGAWSQPVEIATASGNEVVFDVVIDARGNATAVWHSLNDGEEEEPGKFVRAASRPLGGAWSEPVELSGSTGRNPQIAVNPNGDVTAVWTGSDPDTDNSIVRSKSRPAGEAWDTEATDLSSDAGNATDPQVAVDPGGDATAAWSYSENGDIAVQAAHRAAGEWSGPIELWDDAADLAFPSVALATDPQGDTTAIWSSFGPGGQVMRSSTSAAGGAWSRPVELSAPDGSDNQSAAINPRIVADPQGSLTATWAAAEGTRLQAVHRPEGSEWSRPVDLAGPDDLWAAEVAVDPQGYVTALWIGTFAVSSRVFDPVAPLLNDVTVPVSGVAGEPVAMSVDPFDVWSSVTTRWDFGDGGSGTGAKVEHCYSSPGEHTVTVTGTDGAANTTSESRTITIEVDPSLPSGSDPCVPPDPGPDPGPGLDPGSGGNPDSDPGPGSIVPVVSDLEQSTSRWRTQDDRRGSRLPIGTTFRFQLNRAADVELAFSRIVTGRRVEARCVKPTKANRNKPRCNRYQARGTLTIAGRAGNNAYAFRGKIHGRTLKPGHYRLLVTAFADGKTSAPASIGFTIAR
jgi:hypothetical protein